MTCTNFDTSPQFLLSDILKFIAYPVTQLHSRAPAQGKRDFGRHDATMALPRKFLTLSGSPSSVISSTWLLMYPQRYGTEVTSRRRTMNPAGTSF